MEGEPRNQTRRISELKNGIVRWHNQAGKGINQNCYSSGLRETLFKFDSDLFELKRITMRTDGRTRPDHNAFVDKKKKKKRIAHNKMANCKKNSENHLCAVN